MGSLVLLIAVVLIFKALFSSFGYTSSNSKKSEEEKAISEFLKQNFGKMDKGQTVKNVFVVDLTKNEVTESKDVKIIENTLKQEAFAYNRDMFLKQVEKVVETIVNGFASGDKGVLNGLLTDKLFTVFSSEIDKNVSNNLFLKSVIVSFDDKKILSDFENNQDVVSVSLNMKQINYIEDSEHNVIHGDKDNSVVIKEVWTFVKNNNPELPVPYLVDSIAEYKE